MNKFEPVLQKTRADCMVCSLAMLLQISYEEACEYFPPKAVKETGYNWEWLSPYLRRCGIWLTWYGEDLLDQVDWKKPGMLDVPSFSSDEYDHIIFWDGEKVIDPSQSLINVYYRDFPETINAVYQLSN